MTTPRAILLDIEGTTSSIAFVAEVLFPYARARLADFVAANPEQVADVPGDPLETLNAWMDADAKETALKRIQGMIWEAGYADGDLKGHVYPDTPEALARWQAAGVPVHIYSSGSIAAQKLLFRHSEAGDMTPFLAGHFDTTTGPKREIASYARIADALALPAAEILFVSDMAPEIAAARSAGMQALLIDRDGDGGDITSLAEVLP